MKEQLGKLRRVNLRDIWQHEASDFTPWLAKENNLEFLGEILGLELELEGQEESVGPFKADILCKDTLTGHYVLIENQLKRTDHNHLGQLITYAAGLEAVTIVWIADRFTDEHRAALDWLNEISDDSAHFFGLEVELWQIGESKIAPKFNIISKLNEWVKSISQIAKRIKLGKLTEGQEFNLEYWTEFQNYLLDNNRKKKALKPTTDNYMSYAIGRSGFILRVFITTMYDRVGVGLIIYNENSKQYFKQLELEKEQIAVEISKDLEWRLLPDIKESRILIFKSDSGLENKENWSSLFEWMADNMEMFDKSFRSRIKVLNSISN